MYVDPLPVIVEELEGHQLGIPVDSDDTAAVVALAGNRAGDVRAVTMNVHRIAIVVGEVVAVDIVHVAVTIVVDAVAGDFARIGPDVLHQIGMRVVDPRVDDANEDIGAGLNAPRLGRIDIGISGFRRSGPCCSGPRVGSNWGHWGLWYQSVKV